MWWDGNWDDFTETNICALLSICGGIQNLALSDLTPSMLPSLRLLPLRRLTLLAGDLDVPEISPAYSFATVTHLCLLGYRHHDHDRFNLGGLQSLSHLCVHDPLNSQRSSLHRLLVNSQRLRVLVCTFTFYKIVDLWIDDPRVVIMAELDRTEFIEDRKLGARGGPDFWVRAEEFLAKKRANPTIITQILDV
ncbi:hypothetical protein DFH09DRAFT_1159140 [Mycena vulgaris]|nr:hypothetical protein DFH09DRAFT_1159140 [Mycena vulgaris]